MSRMPIPFTCPHCGTRTQVDEKYAGQSGPCFQCGKTVQVPAASGSQTPSFDASAYSPTPTAPAKSNKLIWIFSVAIMLLALCCVISVPMAIILPAINATREQARRLTCENNLRQIGVALQSYHDAHGCFPPPYLVDAEGQPAHSWRVLILPFLGETELYDRYSFDEPWNGPHNQQLEQEMPPVFRCPSADPALGLYDTNYVAVVGPGLLFDPSQRVAIADVTDGLEHTIAVVESSGPSGAKLPWMSPHDPTHMALNTKVNGVPGPAISSDHPGGANVLLADGETRFLSDAIDPQILQDYLTIGGHESHQPLDGTSIAPSGDSNVSLDANTGEADTPLDAGEEATADPAAP
ncbi:MAG: DUF1559 domain-containing protein [Pirellulales bacterium]|nr:DUF1559 domain-containing protein [Pirellulales bacterium]